MCVCVCGCVFVVPAHAGDKCSQKVHLSPVGFTVFCYALLCCVCVCVCAMWYMYVCLCVCGWVGVYFCFPPLPVTGAPKRITCHRLGLGT